MAWFIGRKSYDTYIQLYLAHDSIQSTFIKYMFLENSAFLIPHGVETNKKYVIIYFIMYGELLYRLKPIFEFKRIENFNIYRVKENVTS